MRNSGFGSLSCRALLAAGVVLMGIGATAAPSMGQTVLHVDDDAGIGGDGSSWGSAFDNLQSALEAAAAAQAGSPGLVVMIKVAQGGYVPTVPTNPNVPQSVTFKLLDKCSIAGGYAGVGAADPDVRDIEAYQTILSGDINGDDLPDFVNYGDNANRVTTANGLSSATLIEGLTLSGGARGMYCESSSHVIRKTTLSLNYVCALQVDEGALSIEECRFIGNESNWSGSAIYFSGTSDLQITGTVFENNVARDATIFSSTYEPLGSTLSLQQCTFRNNKSNSHGGAIYFTQGPSLIQNCTFENNKTAFSGGALMVGPGSHIKNCDFRHNHAGLLGGALTAIGEAGDFAIIENCTFFHNSTEWLGGAVVAGFTTVVNSAFNANHASNHGGAIAAVQYTKVANCTIANNQAGGITAVDYPGGAINVHNSIIWGNTPYQLASVASDPPPPPGESTIATFYVASSLIQGGWPGDGNIDLDPKFIQPGCDNLRLAHDSPCINAGNNALIPLGVTTDLDGNPRIQDGIVDMGAYEGGHDPLPPAACAGNIEQGTFVHLIPTGGAFNPMEHATVHIINENGPDNANAMATQFFSPLHPTAGGFNQLGDALDVQTSIPNGELWMRIIIPFDQSNLNGFNPFDVDITYFDTRIGQWVLAVAGNINNSPGHSGPIGDRIITQGTGSPWGWTFDTGDYGIFWNPDVQKGFAWANVDHATEFAFGVQLPQCAGDCTYPSDHVVDRFDLLALTGAWGLTPVGPTSFADFNRDGIINAVDLLEVLNGWGSCP